jgi:hypothetical protein
VAGAPRNRHALLDGLHPATLTGLRVIRRHLW